MVLLMMNVVLQRIKAVNINILHLTFLIIYTLQQLLQSVKYQKLLQSVKYQKCEVYEYPMGYSNFQLNGGGGGGGGGGAIHGLLVGPLCVSAFNY